MTTQSEQPHHPLCDSRRDTESGPYLLCSCGRERPTCAAPVSTLHDDEDVSPCGSRAGVVEVLGTSGVWEPWCEYHAYWRGIPATHVRKVNDRG